MQKVSHQLCAFNGPSGYFFVIQNICVQYNLAGVLETEKRIPSQVYSKDFVHRYRTAF